MILSLLMIWCICIPPWGLRGINIVILANPILTRKRTRGQNKGMDQGGNDKAPKESKAKPPKVTPSEPRVRPQVIVASNPNIQ